MVELMESEDVDVVFEGLVMILESLILDKIDDDEDEEKYLVCLRDLWVSYINLKLVLLIFYNIYF